MEVDRIHSIHGTRAYADMLARLHSKIGFVLPEHP